MFSISSTKRLAPFDSYLSQPQSVLSRPSLDSIRMDSWNVALIGDGGVGKTALAVMVSILHHRSGCSLARSSLAS
jgi:hypothetical protein